jgi:hypothetical protein
MSGRTVSKIFGAVEAVFHPGRVQRPDWRTGWQPRPVAGLAFARGEAVSPKISTEACVLCQTDTGVPMAMAISSRRHYIEGCGQFCAPCHAAH